MFPAPVQSLGSLPHTQTSFYLSNSSALPGKITSRDLDVYCMVPPGNRISNISANLETDSKKTQRNPNQNRKCFNPMVSVLCSYRFDWWKILEIKKPRWTVPLRCNLLLKLNQYQIILWHTKILIQNTGVPVVFTVTPYTVKLPWVLLYKDKYKYFDLSVCSSPVKPFFSTHVGLTTLLGK